MERENVAVPEPDTLCVPDDERDGEVVNTLVALTVGQFVDPIDADGLPESDCVTDIDPVTL